MTASSSIIASSSSSSSVDVVDMDADYSSSSIQSSPSAAAAADPKQKLLQWDYDQQQTQTTTATTKVPIVSSGIINDALCIMENVDKSEKEEEDRTVGGDDDKDEDDTCSYEEEIIDTDEEEEMQGSTAFAIHATKRASSSSSSNESLQSHGNDEEDSYYEEITVGEDDDWEEKIKGLDEDNNDDDDDDNNENGVLGSKTNYTFEADQSTTAHDTHLENSMASSIHDDDDDGYDDDDDDDGGSVAPPAHDHGGDGDSELLETAISEGARKARLEEVARERALQEAATLRQHRRKLLELETGKLRGGGGIIVPTSDDTPTNLATANDSESAELEDKFNAKTTLLREIDRVNSGYSMKENEQLSSTTSTPALNHVADEAKRLALAELRRHTARELLATKNSRLKQNMHLPPHPPLPEIVHQSQQPHLDGSHQNVASTLPIPEGADVQTLNDDKEDVRDSTKDTLPAKALLQPSQQTTFHAPNEVDGAADSIPPPSRPNSLRGTSTDQNESQHLKVRTNQTDVGSKTAVIFETTGGEEIPTDSFASRKSSVSPIEYLSTPECGNSTRSLIQGFESQSSFNTPPSVDKLCLSHQYGKQQKNPSGNEMKSSPERLKRLSSRRDVTSSLPSMFQAALVIPVSKVQDDVAVKVDCSTSDEGHDGEFYSLEALQSRDVAGIDINRREQYLSPKAFQLHFKMNKDEFACLPKWKRDKAKRSLKLF